MLKIAKAYYEVGRQYKVLKVTNSFKAAKQFRIEYCAMKRIPLMEVYVDLIRRSRDRGWVCYQRVERFKSAKNVVKAYGDQNA